MVKFSYDKIFFLYEDINQAPKEGFVGLGGRITPDFILKFYPGGVFPWFKEGDMPVWFSPDPRWILYPEKVKISHSLKGLLRKNIFTVKSDTCFEEVISACASVKRKGAESTWIDEDFMSCFIELHRMGYAHSVEVFMNDRLVGGLYGLAIGKMFSGESMFYFESGASKVALVYLCHFLVHLGYIFIDCQSHTRLLEMMGAEPVPRANYLCLVQKACREKGISVFWKEYFDLWYNDDKNHPFC
jgi:leucyl/phenylalanyl-tRNA--protein transferase